MDMITFALLVFPAKSTHGEFYWCRRLRQSAARQLRRPRSRDATLARNSDWLMVRGPVLSSIFHAARPGIRDLPACPFWPKDN